MKSTSNCTFTWPNFFKCYADESETSNFTYVPFAERGKLYAIGIMHCVICQADILKGYNPSRG